MRACVRACVRVCVCVCVCVLCVFSVCICLFIGFVVFGFSKKENGETASPHEYSLGNCPCPVGFRYAGEGVVEVGWMPRYTIAIRS